MLRAFRTLNDYRCRANVAHIRQTRAERDRLLREALQKSRLRAHLTECIHQLVLGSQLPLKIFNQLFTDTK